MVIVSLCYSSWIASFNQLPLSLVLIEVVPLVSFPLISFSFLCLLVTPLLLWLLLLPVTLPLVLLPSFSCCCRTCHSSCISFFYMFFFSLFSFYGKGISSRWKLKTHMDPKHKKAFVAVPPLVSSLSCMFFFYLLLNSIAAFPPLVSLSTPYKHGARQRKATCLLFGSRVSR